MLLAVCFTVDLALSEGLPCLLGQLSIVVNLSIGTLDSTLWLHCFGDGIPAGSSWVAPLLGIAAVDDGPGVHTA